MTKTYVLDTNVLLHDPEALLAFEDNAIVLPFVVIEEIDNQKKRQDEIGRNAREVSQKLDALRQSGCLSEGVSLPQGGEPPHRIKSPGSGPFPSGIGPPQA
jgi:PhoH-like ATPase